MRKRKREEEEVQEDEEEKVRYTFAWVTWETLLTYNYGDWQRTVEFAQGCLTFTCEVTGVVFYKIIQVFTPARAG